jgi:transglutaminase-like putative cysteine protease
LTTETGTPPPSIDHVAIDWNRVRRSTVEVRQVLRYEYPGPISDLRQRLVLIPNRLHGSQRLVSADLEVAGAAASRRDEVDPFGNRVVWLTAGRVEREIVFSARLQLEREAGGPRPLVPAHVAARYLEPSPLAIPDTALHVAALALAGASDGGPLAFAHAVNDWVYRTMRYTKGVTTVATTAAEAYALGAGVCQDFAHVMIAVLRAHGIPARYVSGHLLGEGATHAWVEALLPDPGRSPAFVAHAFDPTHGRLAGLSYLTVATGRDYGDVAPTSGWFTAPYSGALLASKNAEVVALDFVDGARWARAAAEHAA